MPHGQNRGGLQSRAVVAVQNGPHRHGVDVLGERGASGQMRGMIGAVGVMHLEADNLAAVEIEDQVARSRAGTSHPSTRLLPVCWRCAWSADETDAVAWRGRGGSSGRARAAPDGSSIHWRYRRLRRPASERSGRAGPRRSAARSPPQRCALVLFPSERAKARAGSRLVAGHRASDHRSSASVGGWRINPRQSTGGSRCRELRRFGQSGSGDLPGGSCVLAFVEDRRKFF